jgi:threonine/homoserine/homoserine lactone efflux protein
MENRAAAATLVWKVVSWATYGTFVLLAALVVIAPGPDFAVVVKNSLRRGRSAGMLTSLGVIQRRRVRRALNVVTGTALIGFASALAIESR